MAALKNGMNSSIDSGSHSMLGAPFGLEREDHSALALVAIRNLQLGGDRIRVGSGAGLLPESRLEREFDELQAKREQVKALFGVSARVATYA